MELDKEYDCEGCNILEKELALAEARVDDLIKEKDYYKEENRHMRNDIRSIYNIVESAYRESRNIDRA
jgi:hypothetical protein